MVFWKHRNDAHVEDGHDGHSHANHAASESEVRHAYEKGRADERKRHKSHPVLGLLVFAVAIVGGLMLFLAVREGSFSRAGAVADQKIAEAKVEGPGAVRDVAMGARSEADETAQILARNGNGG